MRGLKYSLAIFLLASFACGSDFDTYPEYDTYDEPYEDDYEPDYQDEDYEIDTSIPTSNERAPIANERPLETNVDELMQLTRPSAVKNKYTNPKCADKLAALTDTYLKCVADPCAKDEEEPPHNLEAAATNDDDLYYPICDVERTDIIFLLDGSSSVGAHNFTGAQEFMINITRGFEIGPDRTRVALVQYATDYRVEFGFKDHTTKEDLHKAFKDTQWMLGDTLTAEALAGVNAKILRRAYREDAFRPRVLIVITDGDPQDYKEIPNSVHELKGYNMNIFAIGIGDASQGELEKIAWTGMAATSRDNVYWARTYHETLEFQKVLRGKICSQANEISTFNDRLREVTSLRKPSRRQRT